MQLLSLGLNTPSGVTPLSFSNPIPEKRYIGDKFRDFKFGLHALSEQEFLDPEGDFKNDALDGVTEQIRSHNVEFDDGTITQIKDDLDIYGSTKFGEAPENILAVENLATGANKPGWVMQSDILSPLAPVSAARSDTFTIRVLGETSSSNTARAWIELVVQRTPDYIKPDLDPPHHRPHEPHKDLNLNGYWDDSGKLNEQWLDLNRNGELVARPDLPGVGESGRLRDYRDGLLSDLPLSIDPQEEDGALRGISIKGINQRFGRKFKIIQFRWLRSQDV